MIIIAVFLGYLLGSIPTAYIFGRVLENLDIREHGSGNVGATNTFRVLGKGPGICVLVIDILKGVLAVVLIGRLFGVNGIWPFILLGLAAVAGHNWTIFLRFKGGKGIATSFGVLIGLVVQFPGLSAVLLACVAGWTVCFLISGYVSLSSLLAAVILPAAMVLTRQPPEFLILGGVFCVFIIYRHRSNIQRLLAGTESRVRTPFRGAKRP